MANEPEGCKLLTKDQIVTIFRDIVKDYGFRLDGGGVNSFASVDTMKDLYIDGFGRNHRDFIRGSFWARNFAASGGASACQSEYPALLLFCDNERYNFTVKADRECIDLNLLLIDKVPCPDCPKEGLTIGELDRRLSVALNTILKEFYTYRSYTRVVNGQQVSEWLSDGKVRSLMEQIPDQFVELGYQLCCDDIERNVRRQRDELPKGIWLSPHNNDKGFFRGIMTTIPICLCIETDTDFNYTAFVPSPAGHTVCEDC